ncbi:MAG TPA: DUF378 domain-containing protein [Candidatus Levybacteria bacterium]|nr:DUF378 domain-containing protein [Candidatus Levybacteria bacterium]
MKTLKMLAYLLVVVGGLNWGLVGLMELNLVEMLLGSVPVAVQVVYVLVGVSAVWLLVDYTKYSKVWGK